MGVLQDRCTTGIAGLDEVLHGGLVRRRAYLVRGGPGTGKTTLGLHFLRAGIEEGQTSALITLESSEEQLRADAETQGLDLSGISFLDLSPTREVFAENRSYDIFSPADVERDPTTRRIVELIDTERPTRVFVDAITTLGYLAPDAFHFRKQTLSFLRFLVERGATVLMSSEPTGSVPDDDLRFMSDGIIELGMSKEHGTLRRSLSVLKLRGSDFHGGGHSMRLTDRGMRVYPRLVPGDHESPFDPEIVSSGLPELDEMLGGGIERGTVSMLSGPTGIGKTTIGVQFLLGGAHRGERSVLYAFEEHQESIVYRCQAIGMEVREAIDEGALAIHYVEPLRFSPAEFATLVREEVEQRGARMVMIDGTAGYRLTLAGDDLVAQLHALAWYLKKMGVTVILVSEVEGIIGPLMATGVGASFLTDNLIFFRYLEIDGELRKSIGVLKKRLGDFGRALRELSITSGGLRVGEPLRGLRGLLNGVPEMTLSGDPAEPG